MKAFEKWWSEQDERVFDLTEDKECCAATWREALKAIKRIAGSCPDEVLELTGEFISRELKDEESGESE